MLGCGAGRSVQYVAEMEQQRTLPHKALVVQELLDLLEAAGDEFFDTMYLDGKCVMRLAWLHTSSMCLRWLLLCRGLSTHADDGVAPMEENRGKLLR